MDTQRQGLYTPARVCTKSLRAVSTRARQASEQWRQSSGCAYLKRTPSSALQHTSEGTAEESEPITFIYDFAEMSHRYGVIFRC